MDNDVGTIERHPIRGALWGIPLGIGLTMVLVGQKIISLGTWAPFFTFVVGIVLGLAWSWFAPPKGPKGGRTDAGVVPTTPGTGSTGDPSS